MHEGHRKRMLERAREDSKGLADHELLEILLFNCIPRVNTNPLAHQLIQSFGGLKGVISANYEQLCSVQGVGEATASYFLCLRELATRLGGEQKENIVQNLYEFRLYLSGHLRDEPHEIVEIYCLDADGHIKFRKQFTSEDANGVDVGAEELNFVLAAQRPRGVILAHNHPLGQAVPSEEDDRFTEEVQLLCSMNSAFFYDHVIVGRSGYYSYFEQGRMESIRKAFHVDKVIGRKHPK